MIRNNHRISFMVLVLSTLAVSLFSQVPTRLQLVFTADKGKADKTALQIEEMGLGPAEVRDAGNGYKVLTRAFDSYAEANYYKSKVRAAGFNDTFAVKENAAPASPYGEVKSIVESPALKSLRIDFQVTRKPFERPEMTEALRGLNNDKAGEGELFTKGMAFRKKIESDDALQAFDAFIRRFPQSDKLAQAKMMRGYWLLEKQERSAAREQFEAVAKEHASTPEAGEAHLRCAYLMLLDQSPAPEVLKRFLKVARKEAPSREEVRLEAMLRCAALYYRMRDLDTAEAGYKVIEEATSDAEVQAFARMQRAGILLEKAYNGKLPFSKSREICDDLLTRFPTVNIQTRSTAALMAIESLCRDNKFEEAVSRSESYLREFQDTPESPIAHYWLARAFYETGDSQNALNLLQDIINTNYVTEQRFKYIDVTESANRLAAKIQKEIKK